MEIEKEKERRRKFIGYYMPMQFTLFYVQVQKRPYHSSLEGKTVVRLLNNNTFFYYISEQQKQSFSPYVKAENIIFYVKA